MTQRALTGRRVLLRKLTRSLAAEHARLVNNKQILKYTTLPEPYHDRDSVEYLRKVRKRRSEMVWGIFTNGTLIGVISLKHIDSRYMSAELGYLLGLEHWSKGYMLESGRLVLKFAQGFGFRVYSKIVAANKRSIRLIRRLGFKPLFSERTQIKGKEFKHEVYVK